MEMDHGFGRNEAHDFPLDGIYTYEVIVPLNGHLDDDSIVKGIGMRSIFVKILMGGKTKRICSP